MKIKFKHEYMSIKGFEPIEVNNFSILTGKNGSGKTHLLNAIQNGSVVIEEIDQSEIVYYNYNDFTVSSGTSKGHTSAWDNQTQQYLNKLQKLKNDFNQLNSQERNAVDEIIISYIQHHPNFDFEEYFGNQRDYELLAECKKEQDTLNAINARRQQFTPQFYKFIHQYLHQDSIDELTYEKLKQRFSKGQEFIVKQIDCNFFARPNYNFEQYFGNKRDYELLEECKKEQNFLNAIGIKQKQFTPQFYQYLCSTKDSIDKLTYENLKQKFSKLEKSIFKQIFFDFFKNSNFDFEQYFGNKRDFELLAECNEEQDIHNATKIKQKQFTPQFYQFIYRYLNHTKSGIEYITYENLKLHFDEIQDAIDEYCIKEDKDFHKFLKNKIGDKNILNLNTNDFESPNLFLEDIANEEKDYQLNMTQNSLNEMWAKQYNQEIAFLDADEFIQQYGLSPVEQINKVLAEYDCNGYSLHVNQASLLGIDRKDIQILITLFHREKKYTTDFEKLSSGEKTLIALSLLIYKTKKNKIIPRVLLLDEIDSSLHPSMISRLLNVLKTLFVEKQEFKVILATHSPTTVALSPKDSIYIIEKNGEHKIKKEIQSNAIGILTEGIATISEEDNSIRINYNINQTNLPVLFTEGITDRMILETAWKKLFEEEIPFFIQDCYCASFLGNLFRGAEDAQDGIFANYPDKTFIALFDFDGAGYNEWNQLKGKYLSIEEDPKKALTIQHKTKNAYSILLPVPENERISKQVIEKGNETFKSKSSLSIELLFYGIESLDCYFKTKQVIGGGEIVSFNGEKRKFARNLCSLSKDDFKALLPLFEQLNKIIGKTQSKS